MLTSVNPGVFVEPLSNLGGFLALFIGGCVVVVALVMAATTIDNKALSWVFVVASVLAAFATLSVPFVQVTQQAATEESVLSEYRTDLRDWLNSEYGITVTADEADELTAGEQIAIDLDDDLTAVQLISGPAETVQVQIVGGSVLAPTE